tara:strand:+ start:75 stop:227 length:153 start_codon:yes stop_codon:yes gene_type:complete
VGRPASKNVASLPVANEVRVEETFHVEDGVRQVQVFAPEHYFPIDRFRFY